MDAPCEGEIRPRLGSPGAQPRCSAKVSESCLAAVPECVFAEKWLLIGRRLPKALNGF